MDLCYVAARAPFFVAIAVQTAAVAHAAGAGTTFQQVAARGPAESVALGAFHTCAIQDEDRRLDCWGENSEGQAAVPRTLGAVSQVVAGSFYTCALSDAGCTLTCWGDNSHGEADVPEDLGAVAQVAAGDYHACAISTPERSLRCWGDSSFGLDSVPPSLGPVAQVAAGRYHTCAIHQEDGTLSCWGRNFYGQTAVPQDLGSVLQVAAAGDHTCAIRQVDHSLICWGDDIYGQASAPAQLGPVAEVATGRHHTCAVSEPELSLTCWGDNHYDQLAVPASLGPVLQVVAGRDHTCAANADGALSCWGQNENQEATAPADLGPVASSAMAATAQELLFHATDDSVLYHNSWDGWFNTGHYAILGKQPAYDTLRLQALLFEDGNGAFMEYALTPPFAGQTLLEVVRGCFSGLGSSEESPTLNGTVCTGVGYLTRSALLSGVSNVLDIGVAFVSGHDWTLFMPFEQYQESSNITTDLQGWALGMSGKTSSGNMGGSVKIRGSRFMVCPIRTPALEETWDWELAVLLLSLPTVLLCAILIFIGRRRRWYSRIIGRPCFVDEEPSAIDSHLADSLPRYWTNKMHFEGTAFDQLSYVDPGFHEVFDKLLAETYVAKVSQDRACPKRTCPKTPRGCACVQPGGSPGLPEGYRAQRVIRVEDSHMWERYVQKRKIIEGERRSGAVLDEIELESRLDALDPPATTECVTSKHPELFEPLDTELNEVYLWHGTSVRNALAISHTDFRVDLAGSGKGTMYGRGTYLAENSTKADEYSSDERGGYYEGVFALVLVRVCLGKMYYTTERDMEAATRVRSGQYDSVLGDRATSVDTFREFVVYDAAQVYPEYVVLYTRMMRAEGPEAIETRLSMPLHLEVPLYWSNYHRNPRKEAFCYQYKVRESVRNVLLRLAEAALTEDGKSLTLLSARRVEHARRWNHYIEFKQKLLSQLPGCDQGEAGSVAEAAGDDDARFGRVLTRAHVEAEPLEEVLSAVHLAKDLNEHWLWHGTTRKAAERIVLRDFRIPRYRGVAHGQRYGKGAYFADDLSKSLQYAPEENGVRYVLLSRVLCGEYYYTEAKCELDADLAKAKAGKHSVLANPEGKGPREFVVTEAAQVYPEYILELQVGTAEQAETSAMEGA